MKTVAVSGLHRGENPQSGPPVIASLRRRFSGIRIVGLCYDPLESGLYVQGDQHPDAVFLMPFPGGGPEECMDRLKEVIDRERLDCIVPCLDSELSNFIDLEGELLRRGVRCVLPSRTAFDRRHKSHLEDLCRKAGVTTPETKAVHDLDALTDHAEEMGYPLYVKGRLHGAHLVYSKADLVEACNSITHVWGWPVLVQEAVVGEEYDVAGIGDGAGEMVCHCAIRKLLRTSQGKGAGGVVIEDPELVGLCRSIIRELEWNGPFELEFVKAQNKPHTLIEMNPRFPAWIDFPSQLGCNMPAHLLERLFGMPQSPVRECKAGEMFLRHASDIVTNIAEIAALAQSGERHDDAMQEMLKVLR